MGARQEEAVVSGGVEGRKGGGEGWVGWGAREGGSQIGTRTTMGKRKDKYKWGDDDESGEQGTGERTTAEGR